MANFKVKSLSLALGYAAALGSSYVQAVELKQIDVVSDKKKKLVVNSETATKSNMKLIETPAAVIAVDRSLLEDQAATTLQQSIRNVSGVHQAGNNYGIGDNLQIRGLGANYVYDGMYGGAGLGNSYNPTRTTTNIEKIEVLKGPASGLYGMGSAGGVVNLVEKKPKFKRQMDVRFTLGEWNTNGVMLDSTDAINNNLAYRLVLNSESSDGFRDLSSERKEAYASLLWDNKDNHSVTLSLSAIDDENQIDSVGDPVRILNWDDVGGTPRKLQGKDLPNGKGSNAGVQLNDRQRQELADSLKANDGLTPYKLGGRGLISPLSRPNEGDELRLKLRHEWDINDSASLSHAFLLRDYKSEFVRQTGAYNYNYWNRRGKINANPRGPLVEDGTLYPYAIRRQEYRKQISDETSAQYFGDLKIQWELASIAGEHLISANYEKRDMNVKSWSIWDKDYVSSRNKKPVPYIYDFRKPNWPPGRFEDYSPYLSSNYNKEVNSYGVSLQEVLYFTDKLTARAGYAYNRIKQEYQNKSSNLDPKQDTRDSGQSYNLGINYRLHDQVALFASAAQGRTAYSILGSIKSSRNPVPQPDSESESTDLGVRFTGFNENLVGSVVRFDSARTNLRYSNKLYNDDPTHVEYNVSVPKYFYDNEDKNTGWELDLAMALSQNWSVNLNSTWQKNIQIRKNVKSVQRKGIPKKFNSLWVNYNQPLFNGDLGVSLGRVYTGRRTVNSGSFGLPTAYLPANERFDAAISYKTGKLKLRLNVENLTDETYYEKAMFLGGLPGNERNFKLTAYYSL